MAKKTLYIILPCIFFAYGLGVGLYKTFPFHQLLAIKHYVEQTSGSFEKQDVQGTIKPVNIQDTFLQRLLIKKVPISGFSGHGGGLSRAGHTLYIVTNKGSVQSFNLEKYDIVPNNISGVPMNFSGLIKSGHPYKNNFRIPWFRVNGVYAEETTSNTHTLYVSHNSYDSEKDCITHNISKLDLQIADKNISQINNWKTIFVASPCIEPVQNPSVSIAPYPGHISGGPITSFDKHHLLVSIGDYNRNGIGGTDEYAMDSSNPYGKFILLNKKSGDWSIYSKGSKNASGLYIDRNSVIWSVENGPEGGDELNIITEDENYGWPKVSYGIWYDPSLKLSRDKQDGSHAGYRTPIFSWVPSVAPSSIIKIEGEKFRYWQGDLIMGTMRDQSLHRMRLDKENRVVYNERIPFGHRIRDMIILNDDKIALITDDGYLVLIDDGGPSFRDMDTDAQKKLAVLEKFNRFTDSANKETAQEFKSSSIIIFEKNCASCHNLDPHNQIGPHLHELFDRKVGSVDSFNYSQALKRDSRNWNSELLKSFLKSPESVFEGTEMQKISLNPNDIDSLISFLKKDSPTTENLER